MAGKKYFSIFCHFLFFLLSNIYSAIAYLVWMSVLTPVRYFAPSIYWKIESEIFYWLLTVCGTWMDFRGYRVIECGDNIDSLQSEECLVLCNHQSTADVPVVMLALHNKKKAACGVMWMIYRLFKLTNFGIVCTHREDFFVDVGKTVRERELTRFKNHLIDSYLALKRKWLVIFPEGGFLFRGQENNQRYARQNNLPELEHVMLPRVGAVNVALNTIGEPFDARKDGGDGSQLFHDLSEEHSNESPKSSATGGGSSKKDPSRPVKWIIDMTIAYKNKEPLEFLGTSFGLMPRNDTLVHWRAYRVKDVPRDEAGLTTWLYARYIEKEKMLDKYYKTGKLLEPSENSPFPPRQPKYIRFDFLYQLMVHVALMVLFYLQFVLICKPAWAFISFLLTTIFHIVF